MSGFDLEQVYLALGSAGTVAELPGETFMDRLALSPPDMTYLMGVYPVSTDWPHWEMHPAGHEVLVMLEGRLEMVIDHEGAVTSHEMGPGTTLVMPPGAWHRAKVIEPGRLLGVTCGLGTEHRPA